LNTTSNKVQPIVAEVHLKPVDNERLANLCGPLDKHLRQLERRFGVEINNRGNNFRVIGSPGTVELAARLIEEIYAAGKDEMITAEKIHLHIQNANIDDELDKQLPEELSIKTKHGIVKGRTPNQRLYLENIQDHDINFGIGPAGTGKTY